MKQKIFIIIMILLLLTACAPAHRDIKVSEVEAQTESKPVQQEQGVEKEKKTISAKTFLAADKARLALVLAVDKSQITNDILANGSEPIDYLVPKGLETKFVDFRSLYMNGWHSYDLVMAKQLWRELKEELDFTEIELRFLTYDDQISMLVSEAIKKQLETNLDGLTIVIDAKPFKEKIYLSEAGKYDIELSGWQPDYPDAMTYLDLWQSDNGHNHSGFSSAYYDDLIQKSKSRDFGADESERLETLQEAERYLIDKRVALLPLFQQSSCYLQNPAVEGVIFHDFGARASYQEARTTVKTNDKYIIRLLASSDIPTMDNSLASSDLAFTLMVNVLEGLVRLDKYNQEQLAGAEKVTISDDGLIYRFDLRKDALWSNGKAVTAHDYVYSWQRLADPSRKKPYRFLLNTALIANSKEVLAGELPLSDLGVKAIDDYTLEVRLEKPTPYFLKLMFMPSFYPINEEFAKTVGDDFGTDIDKLLYNGAYVLDNWQDGYGYSLAKSETYYNKENVLNDGISYLIIKDMANRVHQFEIGAVDYVGLNREYVEKYRDYPDFHKRMTLSVYYLLFNLKQ